MSISGTNSINENAGQVPPQRHILLSPRQFEVIFQVTIQLRNYQVERLNREGMTPRMLEFLSDLVRSIRSIADQSSMVRIQVVEGQTDGLPVTPVLELGPGRSGAQLEAVGQLPESIAEIWQSLLKFVISSLGDRELFLRTGYYSDEIDAAIKVLVVSDSLN